MDFKEFRLGLYRKWERRILNMCWCATGIVAVVEIAVFICFLKFSVMTEPVPLYLLKRFVLPTGINLLFSIIGTLIVRSPSFSPVIKNYVVSYTCFAICSVIAIFHNYFRFLLVAPGVPIFMCAIFAEPKLLKRIFYSSFVTFAVSAVMLLADPIGESIVLRVMTLSCCFGLLIFCYVFANSLLSSQTEQINFVYSSYTKQLELIHELRVEPLTRLYNRIALTECIQIYIRKFNEGVIDPHLVMIDLDHFKTVNDRFGHANGDIVLVKLAEVIKNRMGGIRRAFRYGGEEFVLLFEQENTEHVQEVVEGIRSDFMNYDFAFANGEHLTLSAGIAPYRVGWEGKEWFNAADSAMYKSKMNGRNQVTIVENSFDGTSVIPLVESL